MKILIIEPFYGGSHKAWMDGFRQYSRHDVEFLTLPARYWKWRMHGAAITLSKAYAEIKMKPDVLLVSDFLDLALFKSLIGNRLSDIPVYIYFHENQITYPWSETDQDVHLKRDRHYGFINYSSALVSDRVLFNSKYHLEQFVEGLTDFLKPYPDYNNLWTIQEIADKCDILHLGLDLKQLEHAHQLDLTKPKLPVILWNHRWEYDKNPEAFFRVLIQLKERGVRFRLIVLGKSTEKTPNIFEEAHEILKDEILHWGYCDDKVEYAKWLWIADILPVTSIQDFFGISVIEAVYCNTVPLLPQRLAYTEHFNIEHERRQFFYTDNRDLLNRLQRYCFDVNIIRKQNTQGSVDHYDWSNMIQKYDHYFSKY